MMNYEEFTYVLDGEQDRLDRVLLNYFPNESRSTIQKWIKDQQVTVNDKQVKANYVTNGDETIELQIPIESEELIELTPDNSPLDIIFEDSELIIVNKPQGLVVHPSKGHPNGTLVNRLVYHFQNALSDEAGLFRPGIVHRIDKDTSGLIAIAKNNSAHRVLAQQLMDRTMGRIYTALVLGEIGPQTGIIDIPLRRDPKNRLKYTGDAAGKEAITHFKVIERYVGATLVEAKLDTGRTHQIRAHFDYIGHPIVGDPLYRSVIHGSATSLNSLKDGQYLHASKLHLIHPVTQQEMKFEAPMPDSMRHLLGSLTPLNP